MKLKNLLLGFLLIGVFVACDDDSTPNTSCGDGIVTFPEECDPPSQLACNDSCMRDESKCGDGSCEAPETNANCPADCHEVVENCGNNVIDDGEECDGDNLNNETCETQDMVSGTLKCDPVTCKLDTSECEQGIYCGNNVTDQESEDCDGTDLSGQTCLSLGYSGGILRCLSDCTWDTEHCTSPDCGNLTIEEGEECDSDDLNSETCETQGFSGGDLKCSATCQLDTSDCSSCQNGVKEGDEACDGTDFGVQTCTSLGFSGGTLGCSSSCTLITDNCSTCGDGVLSDGEQCELSDLGGATCESRGFSGGTLSCTDTCQFNTAGCFNETCGDGEVNGTEDCDQDNLNNQSCTTLGFAGGTLSCSSCTFNTSGCSNCGDGNLDVGEACDGSNLNSQTCETQGFDSGTLGCLANCTFNTSQCVTDSCGDGTVSGIEACDGSNMNGNTCASNGFDGGTISCNENCTLNTDLCYSCGDGEVNGTEECDSWELNDETCESLGYGGGYLSCTDSCSFDITYCSICGDGEIGEGEECDDGNTDDFDGCTSACRVSENAYRPIRLTGGEGSNEGRLEMYKDGSWHAICDDNWWGTEQNTADVICRQLGYTGTGHTFISEYSAISEDDFIMDDINCDGTEEYLHQCPHEGKDDCFTYEALGVACVPGEGDVRLVEGPNGMEGKLQVYHSGSWGDVCDDIIQDSDPGWYGPRAVCSQLGHKFDSYNGSYTNDGNYLLDNVDCNGTEKRIVDCAHNDWGDENCFSWEVTGVKCTVWDEGDIMLKNGDQLNNGIIKILNQNVWGTICNDGVYGDNATYFSSVACYELGFTTTGSVYTESDSEETDPIWLDEVTCTGSEAGLEQCTDDGWGIHDCNHWEDLGLICTP
ncbi:MAG: scavenger receptor cysteine-rich domain-containing protein [Deltaproteobacteria bacterium]|nr:scavenger receptor cysteine-rich domain-containing protein [Deltaproteobacteria bacterium]